MSAWLIHKVRFTQPSGDPFNGLGFVSLANEATSEVRSDSSAAELYPLFLSVALPLSRSRVRRAYLFFAKSLSIVQMQQL